MGKKSQANVTKNKEKRQARKLEQHRIADGMSYVTSANKLTHQDLSDLCKDLIVYRNNDLEVEISIQRVSELDENVLKWVIDLLERNMRRLYESCAWGWNKAHKVEELTEDTAWYAIARDNKGTLLAFSHFRFDMDYGNPVLYCYELQVEPDGRRQGLGQRVMAVLEKLAKETRMRCVRLTVLTNNPPAAAFFQACGYVIDETSPPKEEANHYEILSKSTDSSEQNAPSSEDTSFLSEAMSTVQVGPCR